MNLNVYGQQPVVYVCDVCGTDVDVTAATSGERVADLPDGDTWRVSRETKVEVYGCREHFDDIAAALCHQYGYAH